MANLWKNLVKFVEAHKAITITAGSVVLAGALGTGAYAAYQHFQQTKEPEQVVVADVEDVEEKEAEPVDIPNFKKVVIAGESVEKDLTIYISDENNQSILGVPFQVKLLSTEDAKELEPYIAAIQEVNAQIAEYTGKNETGEKEEDAIDDTQEEDKDADSEANENAVTIYDEEGEVVNVVENEPEFKPEDVDDKLLAMLEDKEVALQAYGIVINDMAGEVYTDDDKNGVISEKEMTPGDYVACLMYDETDETLYEPQELATGVNVKDKVEYKVVKEITKKVEKDKADIIREIDVFILLLNFIEQLLEDFPRESVRLL